MDPFGEYDFKTVALERLRFSFQQAVSPALMESLKFDWMLDEITWTMVLTVRGEVLADKLPPAAVSETKTVYFKRPATWWQAWKAERHNRFIRWLFENRPVRYVDEKREVTLFVNLDRYRTYPEQGYVLPAKDWGRPVLTHVLTTNTEVTPR